MRSLIEAAASAALAVAVAALCLAATWAAWGAGFQCGAVAARQAEEAPRRLDVVEHADGYERYVDLSTGREWIELREDR